MPSINYTFPGYVFLTLLYIDNLTRVVALEQKQIRAASAVRHNENISA